MRAYLRVVCVCACMRTNTCAVCDVCVQVCVHCVFMFGVRESVCLKCKLCVCVYVCRACVHAWVGARVCMSCVHCVLPFLPTVDRDAPCTLCADDGRKHGAALSDRRHAKQIQIDCRGLPNIAIMFRVTGYV